MGTLICPCVFCYWHFSFMCCGFHRFWFIYLFQFGGVQVEIYWQGFHIIVGLSHLYAMHPSLPLMFFLNFFFFCLTAFFFFLFFFFFCFRFYNFLYNSINKLWHVDFVYWFCVFCRRFARTRPFGIGAMFLHSNKWESQFRWIDIHGYIYTLLFE